MREGFFRKGAKVKGQGRGMICSAFGLYFLFIIFHDGFHARESRLGGENPPLPPFSKGGLGGFWGYFLNNSRIKILKELKSNFIFFYYSLFLCVLCG
jgi:hypothetical protein